MTRSCHCCYGRAPIPISVSVYLWLGLTRRELFGVREFLPRGVEVLLNLLSAWVVATQNPI